MSGNEKNVPKRRFKEFQNAEGWEQCKVGELTNVTSAARVHKEEWASSGIPFFRSSDVVSAYKGTENEKAFISYELFEQLSRVSGKLGKDDILVTGGGSIGIPYIVPNNAPLYSKDADLIWIKSSKKFNSQYLYTFFTTSCFRNYVSSISHIGTIAHYTIEQVKDTPIYIPSLAEQEKVGVFFKQLDNIINLHKNKLEKMKALKKAYLKDMFPAEGECKPKLRFAGFTGDWEQHKVKEIFKVTRGYVLAATETTDKRTDEMPYPVYSSQTKDNGLMGYYKDFLYESAITWTTDGANAGTVNYRAGKFYCTNVCGVLLSDDGYVNKMVSEALNNISWKHVSKVGNPKLMNNVMSEIVVSLPKTIEEQNTISDFLNRLDNLITLHQRKLEKLQNIKKAYLNEMFI